VVAACGAAVIASPYFVVAPGRVLGDAYEALYLAGRYGFDGWQIDPAGGYLFYLKTLVWGLGWGLFLLVLAGLIVAGLRHRAKDLVLISLPITVFVFMGRQQMYFARLAVPMVPALLVMGASLLESLVTSLAKSRRQALWGLSAGALLFTVQPLASSLRSDSLLTRTDTRTLAKEWIEAAVPAGSRIAVDWPAHGPPLSTAGRAYPAAIREYDILEVGGAGLADHPLEWYHDQGFDYLIASSSITRIPLADAGHDAERRAFYASLDRELELVQEFRSYEGETDLPFVFDEIYGPAVSLWQRQRPGPTIKVYTLQ
jgi:hypothetical protein